MKRTRKEAIAFLIARYNSQCERFPKTREISLALYLRRNLRDAMNPERIGQ
jgi:hypothetical protein